MNAQTRTDQLLTPEVLAWMTAQAAQGHSKEEIFNAMLAAGWHADAAAQAVQLTAEELAAVVVPALALPLTHNMVDAGDKWVEVLFFAQVPNVIVLGNLLGPSECEALIEAATPRLARSLTVDAKTGGEELNADRTSEGMFFRRGENPIVQQVEARIARIFGWPQENGEGLQVLRYGPGAEYKPHYDYFDPAEPGTPAILQRGGQRVATLIMYLHEPEEGGATVFPDIELRVEPRRGNAVFFSYPQALPSSRTLHGGEPVIVGEKWIATKWLRERLFT
ncbi:MAG: 2OG-Fe(II) oxygenase [Polaromonas sp.]|uniref:2OG-Fe(II) oxygenase n=1 Tax=Polaromonas sp. TaxID=1869339 RepID=UPI003266C1AD